jgi:hypothetical protein
MNKSATPEEIDLILGPPTVPAIDLANRLPFAPWTSQEIAASADLGWLIGDDEHPTLLANALWCIFGLYKHGKTYYSFEQAFCVAFGIRFNDQPTAHGDICYVIAEGGMKRMYKRFVALYEKYKDDLQEKFPTAEAAFDAGHFNMVSTAVNLVDFNAENGVDKLMEQIDSTKNYLAIYLDTWALMLAASGGSDTDDKTVMPAVSGCKRIQNTFGCTVVIVQHVAYNLASQDRPKGLSDLPAACDGGMKCEKTLKSGEEVFSFISSFQRHSVNGYATHAKLVKYGPNLCLDFLDSEGVVKSKLKPDVRKAFELIGDSEILAATWHALCDEAKLFEPKGSVKDKLAARRNAFSRAKSALVKAGLIAIADDVVRIKATANKAEAEFGH